MKIKAPLSKPPVERTKGPHCQKTWPPLVKSIWKTTVKRISQIIGLTPLIKNLKERPVNLIAKRVKSAKMAYPNQESAKKTAKIK